MATPPHPNGQLTRFPEREDTFFQESLLIGRSSRADVMIDSDRASRKHCLIAWVIDCFRVTDLGSANGTRVNNRDIGAGVDLEDGDIISVAGIDFEFRHFSGPLPEPEPEDNPRNSDFTEGVTKLDGGVKEVIILVADLVGFSKICRHLADHDLTCLLNLWYGASRSAIREAGGEIDKFLGDGFLAYWECRHVSSGRQIVDAACSLASSLELPSDIEESLSDAGLEARCNVGLHAGRASVGTVLRSEKGTIVGNDVNLAFRIESATREVGFPICASKDFVEAWADESDGFQSVGLQDLKGYNEMELFVLDPEKRSQ